MNSPTDFDTFLDEYRAFILQTWSTREHEFLHAAWGFIGEALELETSDEVEMKSFTQNQYKELGDLFYYLFTLERIQQVKIDWTWDEQDYDPTILHSAERISNLIKKHVWYGHTLQDLNLSMIYRVLCYELENTNDTAMNFISPTPIAHSPRSIMQMNMDKLKARYPDGHFTSEHAELRLDIK